MVPTDEGIPALQRSQCLFEASEPTSAKGNNFTKGSKWSPDGSVVLTAHDDAVLRLWRAPDINAEVGAMPKPFEAYAKAPEGGPVLDFCFFPGFTWDYLPTCCFLTSSQDHPIHLRDALSGTLRNTYRPYNQVDEVCHAFSLCFSIDGSRILAGFPQAIRIFDVQRPGRQVEEWLLSTRKGRGQKGIIGALTAAPAAPGLYAAGSYNRSVCIYHHSSRGKPVAWLADKQERVHMMGGVTQLAWVGEQLLLSGHRCDQWLRAWDLRMAGGEGEAAQDRALLHRFPRATRTHQRFLFGTKDDLLTTGDDSGNVLLYSLSSLREVGRISGAHTRPCVCAMPHPHKEALLTASGTRSFPNYDVESPPQSRSQSPSPSVQSPRSPRGKRRRQESGEASEGDAAHRLDNSLRIWRLEWG